MIDLKKAPPIDQHIATLRSYYDSLESRIGYRLFLGETRHYGYYERPDDWPWPITPALRSMEAQMFEALSQGCPKGSRLLDAGCGVGHVALYMAREGDYKVECIDAVPHHIRKAKRNIADAGMQSSVTARVGDYHHLEQYADNTFDGIYTMETLVHSKNTLKVLQEFRRILKPGGSIVLHEYDHEDIETPAKYLGDSMKIINRVTAMPGNASFDYDVVKELADQAGFKDVRLRDMSRNIAPMLWLFYIFAIIPYQLVRLLGLEHRFINTLAAVQGWRGRQFWRYTQVTGKKPV